MSRYCAGLVIPGCGRQSRDVGAHGKTESNAAVGSWVARLSDADAVLDRRAELARREHVRVVPHAVLRVVREELEVLRLERVAEVGSRRVAGRRDRDAVPERLARVGQTARGELGQDPAIDELV